MAVTGVHCQMTLGKAPGSERAKDKVRDQSTVRTPEGVTCTSIMGHTNVFHTKCRKFGTSAAEKMGKKDLDKKQARMQQSEVFRMRPEEDSGSKVKGSIGKQGQGSASAPVSPKLMGNLSTDIQALYLDPLFTRMIASSAQFTTALGGT